MLTCSEVDSEDFATPEQAVASAVAGVSAECKVQSILTVLCTLMYFKDTPDDFAMPEPGFVRTDTGMHAECTVPFSLFQECSLMYREVQSDDFICPEPTGVTIPECGCLFPFTHRHLWCSCVFLDTPEDFDVPVQTTQPLGLNIAGNRSCK